MPDPVDHQRLRAVFLGACDLDEDAREDYLAEHCRGDDALRAAVEKLLVKDDPDDSAFAAPALPEQIGAFRILSLLGEGGMGRVYEAEQQQPRRRVALKVLRVGMASESTRRRFAHEAEVLAKLQHHGIAQVYAFGTAELLGEQLPYLAMELVAGRTLLAAAEHQRLSVRQRVGMFVKICDAVGHAHGQGVIHRDLKPANILVDGEQPKVLDFGISLLTDGDRGFRTMTGQLVGTVGYMSPEQLDGHSDELDVRSDVYALGVMLFELLGRRQPLQLDGEPLARAAQTLRERAPPMLGELDASLRGELELIASKCLEKEPHRRYANASALADDLRRYLQNEPIVARPATAFYQLRKFARRHLVAVVGALAFTFALVAGMVTTWIYAVRADEQRAQAQRESYRATIAAAAGTVQRDPERAQRYLQSAPAALRGWEWQHLQAALDTDYRFAGDAHVVPIDGDALVAVLEAGALVVRRAIAGNLVATLDAAGSQYRTPRLSPDGARVAVHARDRDAIDILRLADASKVTFPTDLDEPRLAWGPDGKRLLVYGGKQPGRVFTVEGTPQCQLPVSAQHAAFTNDGKIWALNSQRLTICDAASGLQLDTGHSTTSHAEPAFSRDGSIVAIGNLRACEVLAKDDRIARMRFSGHRSHAIGLAIDAGGTRLASSETQTHAGTTRVIDLRRGQLEHAFLGGGMTSLAFVDRSQTLVAAGPHGVRVLPMSGAHTRVLRAHESFLTNVTVHADGTLLLSSGWDRRVVLWDAITGQRLHSITTESPGPVTAAFHRDGDRMLAIPLSCTTCWEWDLATGELLATHPADYYFAHAATGSKAVVKGTHASLGTCVHSDLRASLARDQLVIASRSTNEVLLEHPLEERACCLALDDERTRLAIGYADGRIELWRLDRELTSLHRVGAMAATESQPYCLAFDPSGTRLVSGTELGVIDLWDVASRDRVAELAGHDGYVHAVVFSPDGTQIVSASGDSTVRVWDTVPHRVRAERTQLWRKLLADELPHVRSLLDRLEDPKAVADELRNANTSDERRRAQLRVLMQLTKN